MLSNIINTSSSLRIIVAADSLALPRKRPYPINYRQIWPELLKQELLQCGIKVDLLKHAARARTLPQLVQDFDDIVGLWEPHIIIIQIGIVDCAPRIFSQAQHRFINSKWIHWRISRFIIQAASRHRRKIIKARPWVRYTPLKLFQNNLEILSNHLNDVSAFVIVLPIFPTFSSHAMRSPGYNESVESYNRAWEKWCLENHHYYINYVDIINEKKFEEVVQGDGHHLSLMGNKLVAQSLLNVIMKAYQNNTSLITKD